MAWEKSNILFVCTCFVCSCSEEAHETGLDDERGVEEHVWVSGAGLHPAHHGNTFTLTLWLSMSGTGAVQPEAHPHQHCFQKAFITQNVLIGFVGHIPKHTVVRTVSRGRVSVCLDSYPTHLSFTHTNQKKRFVNQFKLNYKLNPSQCHFFPERKYIQFTII